MNMRTQGNRLKKSNKNQKYSFNLSKKKVDRVSATKVNNKMIYFPHIPKAGGTTLRQIFDRNLGRSNIIGVWDKKFRADFNADEFPLLQYSDLSGKLAVYGHLNVSTALENKAFKSLSQSNALLTISAVREPIDRIVSLFNYIRANKRHPPHQNFAPLGLIGFVNFCKTQSPNYQYNFLKSSSNESVSDILSSVVTFSLESSITGYSRSLSLISGKEEVNYPKVNVTADRNSEYELFTRADIPEDLLSEIMSSHSLDYELYNKSKLDFDRKIQYVTDWIENNPEYIKKVKAVVSPSLSQIIQKKILEYRGRFGL